MFKLCEYLGVLSRELMKTMVVGYSLWEGVLLILLYGTFVQGFVHPVYRGIIPPPKFPHGTRPEGCVSSCKDMPDGDYPSCEGCLFFTTCSNGHAYPARPCPWFGGLFWNEREGRCDWHPAFCFRWPDDDDVFKPSCVASCEDMPDGDYQSCASCHVYVTCVGGYMWGNRICVPGLVWDDRHKTCEWYSTTCKIRKHMERKIAQQRSRELEASLQQRWRKPAYKVVGPPHSPPIIPRRIPQQPTFVPFRSPLIPKQEFFRSNLRETVAAPVYIKPILKRTILPTFVQPPNRTKVSNSNHRDSGLINTNLREATDTTNTAVRKSHWTDLYRTQPQTRSSKVFNKRIYFIGQKRDNGWQNIDAKTTSHNTLASRQQPRVGFSSGPARHFQAVNIIPKDVSGTNRPPNVFSRRSFRRLRSRKITPKSRKERIALLLARGPV